MTVTIIVPAYNEAVTLGKVLKKLLSTKLDFSKEIIVVNDGSDDKTEAVLSQFLALSSLRAGPEAQFTVLNHKQNQGKGAAVRTGLKKATGDIIAIQDADLEYSPSDLPKLLEPFRNPQNMVVYGSRIKGRNASSHWTFYLGGRLITYITNLLYGTKLTDQPTGYKLFRSKLLKNLKLTCDRFEFCSEITAKIAKSQVEILEIPISYKPRPPAQKKLKWYDGLKAIFTLIKYKFVN